MITGSHNPPQFNGFKICIGNDTIYGEQIQELRNMQRQFHSISLRLTIHALPGLLATITRPNAANPKRPNIH